MKTIKKGWLLTALSLLLLAGCDLLDVNNPNSLIENDLDNPAAAPAIANGAEASLTRALGSVLAPYSVASDEVTWIGTRDAWLELDQGRTTSRTNEFIDEAFSNLSEARWTADAAINRLERFRTEGSLRSTDPLIRSYLYGAIAYITIAETFDDFVLSDRTEASPPIGRDQILTLFDTAISYLDNGLDLTAEGSDLALRLQAVRARAHFSKALRAKFLDGTATVQPLVSSEQAYQDAIAVLNALNDDNGWRYQIVVTPQTPGNSLASNINSRRELRIAETYAQPTSDRTRVEAITLQDPIDQIVAPITAQLFSEFDAAQQYADHTIISVRELLLIAAEHQLATSGADFETYINRLRAVDALTPWSGQIDAEEILRHSRQANLFLQGRRLADLYRFATDSPEWSETAKTPGSFFQITISEIAANPHISF